MRFTGPSKRSCNSSHPSTLLFKIWKNGKTLLYKQQQMVQNGIVLIREHLLNDFQKTQFYSCMDYMLAKNVCDILIIKYKCYCKQAMKQMVSWILQYSHIFQLKFTVHQSGSFKSWLYCVSPQHLNHCSQRCWEGSFGSRTTTQVNFLHVNTQSVSNEEPKQSTNLSTSKTWHAWIGRVLLPWKKNKEMKEQLPCPREQRRPCYFHLSEGLPLFNSVLPSVNPACISYRTLELLLFPSAVFCGPLEGEGTQVDVCPFWPVNAESHNTTESESSTHFFSSFVTKTCLFIQTEKQEPQEDVSTSVTQHGEGKGRRTWGPLQLITTPQACSALSAHYLWWIATDPCQVGSVLWLSQIFCNPLLKTTKRVSAPGLTAPWQTAGAHNPAQAMQETACVQWQWGGSCSSFLGVPVRNRTSFWPSLSSLQPGYFPCQAEEHALPLLKELLF